MEPSQPLAGLIALALRADINEETDEGWLLAPRAGIGPLDQLKRADVEGVLVELEALKSDHPVSIEGARACEVLVAESRVTRGAVRRRADAALEIPDAENGLSYTLGVPSRALMCASLIAMQQKFGEREFIRRIRRSGTLYSFRLEDNRDPWDRLYLTVFRRYLAVRVTSDQPRLIPRLRRYIDSVLFHFAYNLDNPLTLVGSFDSVLPERAIRHSARPGSDTIDCPRLIYDSDLVHRYIAAIGSQDVLSQFLGFYQIAEHHFERLYDESVVSQVRALITAPGFSSRRDTDIQRLSKKVSRLVREHRDETGAPDEQTALSLVLATYVNLPRLCESLEDAEPGSVAWYSQNEVTFSGGDSVKLAGPEQEAIASLSRRIYKTRNSVVHAKLGDRARYFPRRDDAALAREAPLMRAVAEEVMISTATVLD